MSAIRLLYDLQIENCLATPEEQESLAKYVGWSDLSMAFDEKNASWANEYKELKAELSDEEYRSAMESTINSYFVQNPEMLLGEMKMESTRFDMDTACKARQEILLSELLSEAVQRISGEIPEQDYEIDEIFGEQDAEISADPNVRNFSFALVDSSGYFRENDYMADIIIYLLYKFTKAVRSCDVYGNELLILLN